MRHRIPDLSAYATKMHVPLPSESAVRQVDQGAIADNKQLEAVLAMVRDKQLRRGTEQRSGPRRRDQRDARLFKVG
ncbi:MAG: hypothetical protein JO208_14420 [Alphaproteobacteria bacterium]|nr:hypothetical protein [Alphaproteobacteria bacterium]